MRRWTAAVVLLVLTAAAAACGSTGDGQGAPAPASAPTTPAPPPACHPAAARGGVADRLEGSVDCAAPHAAETIHSGRLSDVVAASPPAGSRALRSAFDECDRQAAAALGGDWRTARLRLDLVLPSPAAWAAGQRWFRCDVVELTGVGPDGRVADRSGSLAGALAPGSPLLLRCALVKLDKRSNVDTVVESPCDKEHQGEFAGVWTAPDKLAYPVKDRDYVPFYQGCLETIAAYVGVPYDASFAYRTGYIPILAGKDTFALDRGVRCYLWIRFRPLTASAKGVGEKGFPPNLGQFAK